MARLSEEIIQRLQVAVQGLKAVSKGVKDVRHLIDSGAADVSTIRAHAVDRFVDALKHYKDEDIVVWVSQITGAKAADVARAIKRMRDADTPRARKKGRPR